MDVYSNSLVPLYTLELHILSTCVYVYMHTKSFSVYMGKKTLYHATLSAIRHAIPYPGGRKLTDEIMLQLVH